MPEKELFDPVEVDGGKLWLTPDNYDDPKTLCVMGLEPDGSSLPTFYLTPKQALAMAAQLLNFAANAAD